MLPRTLEPEVMDTPEEAIDYDAMNHSEVNQVFVADLLECGRLHSLDLSLAHSGIGGEESDQVRSDQFVSVLDVGTGTALIPIELCQRVPAARVLAVDLAEEMLRVAKVNVTSAGLAARIAVQKHDAKTALEMLGQFPLFKNASPSGQPADGFDIVMSNSIVHHIPQPKAVFATMQAATRPRGVLFVRDLMRPSTAAEVEALVHQYAGDENAHQQQMFRDSLHAALRVDEVVEMIAPLGIPADCVQATSDRHWTLAWFRS